MSESFATIALSDFSFRVHSDSDDDLFQNIQENDLSEHYLVIILRQLIDRLVTVTFRFKVSFSEDNLDGVFGQAAVAL